MKKVHKPEKGHSKKEAVSQVRNGTKSEGETHEELSPFWEDTVNMLVNHAMATMPDAIEPRKKMLQAFHHFMTCNHPHYTAVCEQLEQIKSGQATNKMDAFFNAMEDIENAISRARGLLVLLGHEHAELVFKTTDAKHNRLEADALDGFACDTEKSLDKAYRALHAEFKKMLLPVTPRMHSRR
ncbi:MAG TPA: hypothetical protein VFB72_00170 [Verrucomicrobiae bacterium]|nr:hypothetical protein [Verrucomicrobiae bacterium]